MNRPYHGRVAPIVRSGSKLAYFICPHCRVMLGVTNPNSSNSDESYLKAT